MAILASDWLDEQKKLEQGQSAKPGDEYGGSVAAPTGSEAPTPYPTAAGATGQPAQKTGTGFINLSDYLGANQGAATGMANSLLSAARGATDAASAGITGLGNTYAAGVQAGTPTDPLLGRLATLGGRGAPVPTSPAAAPPLGVRMVEDPNAAQVAAAKAQSTATYTGPNSMADVAGYQGVSDAAREASDKAKALTTFTGRQTALQEGNKGQMYGRGSSALDAYLSGAAGGQQFADVAAQAGNLSDTLAAKLGDTSAADAAKAYTTKKAGEAQDYLSSYQTDHEQAAKDKANMDRDYDAFARGGGNGAFLGWTGGRPPFSREEFALLSPEFRAALADPQRSGLALMSNAFQADKELIRRRRGG